MTRWTVGDVRIGKIHEHDMAAPVEFMFPGATTDELKAIGWAQAYVDENGHAKMSVHALVVETPGLKIVVDTCVGNDRQGRSLPLWNGLQTRFMEDFRAAGHAPEEIAVVLCTHLHSDHVGWNTHLKDGAWVPTFPNARHLIDRREFEFWQADEAASSKAMLADSLQPIFEAGLVELIDASAAYRVCPEVQLIPTPGHTPGHVSVLIQSAGQTALITGDFMHHPCQIARPEWNAVSDAAPETACATRRAALTEAAHDGRLVIGTHFPTPTAGHVRPDGAAWRFET
ncbi:MBL fold metallo-hydrolase [Phenylobacterium sp.]|uniref:MBL fold metallo-hydrolase n=1 Tax=Phenylobacterium sp. TaxID=1871053 RepID=UPI0035AF8F5F